MTRIPLWMRLLRAYSLRTPFHRGTYRIALWCYQHLQVPSTEVETTIDRTLQVSLRLPIWVDYNIYCLGVYEAPLARFFKQSIRPDAVVIDVGAYIGQYTLLAAKYAPHGHVVALEPHPISFARLSSHVIRNRMSNVTLLQKAAGRERGRLPLAPSSQFSDSRLLPTDSSDDTTEVEVIALDELVEEQELGRVGLVKVDAEGAEGEVLKGAEQTLQKFLPTLVVELDRSREKAWGADPESILAMLAKWGYTFFVVEGWSLKPLSRTVDYANVIAIPPKKD
ncbi:MAG: FkbM family methyltransferase [Anaerolineae bacterium]|nr:FkbM family methyltransferase [Anaerolineae bacterium]